MDTHKSSVGAGSVGSEHHRRSSALPHLLETGDTYWDPTDPDDESFRRSARGAVHGVEAENNPLLGYLRAGTFFGELACLGVTLRNPHRSRSRVPRNNPVNLHAATTTHFLHSRSDAATTTATTTTTLDLARPVHKNDS